MFTKTFNKFVPFLCCRNQGSKEEHPSSGKRLVQENKHQSREGELHCRIHSGLQFWRPWGNHSDQQTPERVLLGEHHHWRVCLWSSPLPLQLMGSIQKGSSWKKVVLLQQGKRKSKSPNSWFCFFSLIQFFGLFSTPMKTFQDNASWDVIFVLSWIRQ